MCFLHACLCIMFMPATHGGRKRALDPLKLEFSRQVVNNQYLEQNSDLLEEQQAFLSTEPSLQSQACCAFYQFCAFGATTASLNFLHLHEENVYVHSRGSQARKWPSVLPCAWHRVRPVLAPTFTETNVQQAQAGWGGNCPHFKDGEWNSEKRSQG